MCGERGIRFTDLRRRVFELVWASHKPVGAYAILETLRDEGLGSAPPTVYRALDFLLEHELVHRIRSSSMPSSAAPIPAEAPRLFLICTQCGNAEELDDERLNAAIARAAEARGFTHAIPPWKSPAPARAAAPGDDPRCRPERSEKDGSVRDSRCR